MTGPHGKALSWLAGQARSQSLAPRWAPLDATHINAGPVLATRPHIAYALPARPGRITCPVRGHGVHFEHLTRDAG